MKKIDFSRERSIHALVLADLEEHPLWDTVRFDVPGGVDLTVAPVVSLPELDGTERMPWALCAGHLADGTPALAVANVFFDPPRIHCPELLVNDRWIPFFLPPAPDFVLAKHGPASLATALMRSLAAVFPITLSTVPVHSLTQRPISTIFKTTGPEPA